MEHRAYFSLVIKRKVTFKTFFQWQNKNNTADIFVPFFFFFFVELRVKSAARRQKRSLIFVLSGLHLFVTGAAVVPLKQQYAET